MSGAAKAKIEALAAPRSLLALAADPGALSARGAGRLAGPGQPRLDRAGRGHHHLSRRQRHPRRHHPAGAGAGPRLGGRLVPKRDFAAPDPAARWVAFGVGRGAGLSRNAALARHQAADDLVGADRRQARDARRMGRGPALCRPRHPPAARGISPAVGSDPRRLRARRATAGRSASTIPATAAPTPSTGRRGKASAIRTCNSWAADRLRLAGVKTSLWPPFVQGLVWRYRKADQST